MFKKFKKKLKRKLIKLLIFLTFLLIFFVAAAINALYENYLYSSYVDKGSVGSEASIEYFDISGSLSSSNLTLNFSFPDYDIKDITGKLRNNKFTINKTVSVPGISGNSNEEKVFKFYKKNGYSLEGICGIMGCLKEESSFSPVSIEFENSWTGKNNLKKGYGIAQWTNSTYPHTTGRRTSIIDWLKSNGYEPYKDSNKLLMGQLKYTLIEPGYDKARTFCKTSKSVEAATESWLRDYEGAYTTAYYVKRLKSAKEFYKKYKGASSSVSSEYENVKLNISGKLDGNNLTFTGTLDGITICGKAKLKNDKLSGSGQYGMDADLSSSIGYTGFEKNTNSTQRKIVAIATSYNDPYRHEWHNLCEAWVNDVYKRAGLHYNCSCCAAHSREINHAQGGKIPVGAVIYSSPSYKAGVRCSCGRDAGHVGIYIGDGKIAGSQMPYIMTMEQWNNACGYGGWSFSGNKVK
ncbi:MAG: phage tail tip lysozyme [Peptostreptococcaceae bacterium]|nr:phage tail tip lysozyme [Peptostreptococcaceae bacterium]MDY5739255.1 phage tail tip lysozyme [Anaerovoracaceae bacterium]